MTRREIKRAVAARYPMPETTCVEKIQQVYEKRKLYERRLREASGEKGSEAGEKEKEEANKKKTG